MLKKLFLIGAALPLSMTAFAQSAPTSSTTYSTAPNITVGSTGCTITGATVFNYNPSTNTLTLVNGQDSCKSGDPQLLTASVSVSISPTSYTLGSNAAAPVITWSNQTPAATVSCSLTPNNGFTVASSTASTWTLSTPTTAGTYNFVPTCTTNTAGYNTAVTVSNIASLTVVSNTPPPPGCNASQLSTAINGKTFQRQCSGTVYMLPYQTTYSNALTDLGVVLGNKQFPSYSYTGQSPTYVIDSGYYVSLQFTPQVAGQFKLTANASYGDGGTVSLSTTPGAFGIGTPNVICSLNYGPLNSLIISTNQGGSCPVTLGQTYYLNLADTDSSGLQLCFGAPAGSCQSSFVSYQLTARSY